jgi:hypothetical protein
MAVARERKRPRRISGPGRVRDHDTAGSGPLFLDRSVWVCSLAPEPVGPCAWPYGRHWRGCRPSLEASGLPREAAHYRPIPSIGVLARAEAGSDASAVETPVERHQATFNKDSNHSPPVTCRQRHRTEVGHVRTVAPQCGWKPLSHRSPAAGRAWPPPPPGPPAADRRAKRGRALAAALGNRRQPASWRRGPVSNTATPGPQAG